MQAPTLAHQVDPRLAHPFQSSATASDREADLPFVSVVVPAHNARPWIGAAIDSVAAQTHPRWELIVVDDASDDGTAELVADRAATDPRVRLLRSPGKGASAARNHGAAACTPEARYLFFLDADDFLRPDALAHMSRYLERHPEVGLLGCQFDVIAYGSDRILPGHRSRICRRGWLPKDLPPEQFETPFEVFFCCTGQGPFAMYRRAVFERTAGWSTDFWGHNDTDMFIQMALEAPVHYLPDHLYVKRKVRTSLEHRPGRDALIGKLRAKWDHYPHPDPARQAMIDDARRHYYLVHEPLRDLKVACSALREFLRAPSTRGARWTLFLFWCGSSRLVGRRLFGPPDRRKAR
jgi:glycosyltransferase involved in cell wall biosynthesis